MIDLKTIKDRILTFAYQGKLAEPNKLPNDNIESIHESIKGYIPVSEEEYLIDIPNEWKWTRLGYVTSNHGQITPSDTFSYIDVGTLDNVNHLLSSRENIVDAKDAPSRAKKIVETGDVIYSTVRPYLHNICIIDKDFSFTPIASTAFCVMHANEEVLDNKYLFYWLLTKEFDKYSNGDPSKGALYPAIGEKDLLRGVIPLPAVSEQKAIVEKIEAVFEILDKINALQNQYASNQEALRSKLIDAAIQGKLTEQQPDDGAAKDLIQLINKEREIQEANGKIKHVESQSSIDDDEIPFEIPTNWEWVRFGDVSYIVRGGSPRPIKQYITSDKNGINWIKIGDVEKGGKYIFETKEKIIPEGEKKSRRVYPGDFLLTNSMSFGRPYISKIEGCIHDGWLLIHDLKGFDQDYLYYLLSSRFLYNQFTQKASGSTVDNLNIDKVSSAIIPLPPLAEQKRIAKKIEELLQYCK
ncbi:restriction endonuclease subunit S [Fibrobacter sp. UWB10]|uniref:restriction endonuclease subunit S n=1 Tax=Fibrobacter sp. UWB10 TaxID=1896201 RepID=UPI002402E030|nr:restriction endonuclease subunit S [Fibrobacter sp. UWB10]SMP41802.1 type I restriction enzyme, S subunit [Fibrobacter sp. UWB10]